MSTVDRAQALQAITESSASESLVTELAYQREVLVLEKERKEAELDQKEHIEVMKMRGAWSSWILRCVIGIVVFDVLFVVGVGRNWLKYDQGWIVPVFVADSLIKVLGLAIIIVGFLFGEYKRNTK
ncbi:hypothetical protein KBD18_00500 [Patescibacteria group bacterium]|nr:hypothetical protein [Patescibacteria group bacterium]